MKIFFSIFIWFWFFIFVEFALVCFFMIVLQPFYRHLDIILIHFYWLSLLESVLRFPALCLTFCGNQLFDSTDCLPRDAGFGCRGWQNSLQFYIYLYVNYFTIFGLITTNVSWWSSYKTKDCKVIYMKLWALKASLYFLPLFN